MPPYLMIVFFYVSTLTKDIKQEIFEYMDSKYTDSSLEDRLMLCIF